MTKARKISIPIGCRDSARGECVLLDPATGPAKGMRLQSANFTGKAIGGSRRQAPPRPNSKMHTSLIPLARLLGCQAALDTVRPLSAGAAAIPNGVTP